MKPFAKMDVIPKEEQINSPKDLAEKLGLNPNNEHLEQLIQKHLYKSTECGAWIKFRWRRVEMGAIIEGYDTGTSTFGIDYPFRIEGFERTVKSVEDMAKNIWNDTHGCPDCYGECEDGNISTVINPNCESCKGDGIII